MHPSLEYLRERINLLDDANRKRQLIPRWTDGILVKDAEGAELINFGGNDYLGIASERVTSPVPTGSTASALVCGWTPLHQNLADRIADLESTESAVVFPSGFAACSGTVATLAEAGDLILSDQLNHASLIDGCRLSRADCVVYSHRDVGQVESILKEKSDRYQRVWIVTDAVFSMDGHLAPLPELCDVAERFGASMIVDEAHGTGVLGESGSGLCEALHVKQQVAVRIGTLSKAIGTQGGFVAGPKVIVDYLVNRCRSLIYSTALAPASVTAAIDAIDVIQNEPERRQHVHQLSRMLRSHVECTTDTDLEACVPIVPVHIGDDGRAVEKSIELAAKGFFVPAIRPPTVPEGTARLRVSLSAAHDESMVRRLIEAL